MRRFSDLDEREVLALAISVEEEHAAIYTEYAHGMAELYPASAKLFTEMAEEERVHRGWLIALFKKRFGDHIPLIRKQDVKGFMKIDPAWLIKPMGIDRVREQASALEGEAYRFYTKATQMARDADVRRLLGDLAAAEGKHVTVAKQLNETHAPSDVREAEAHQEKRQFVLRYVQPGLAGLIDGSIASLAPIFAAASAAPGSSVTYRPGMPMAPPARTLPIKAFRTLAGCSVLDA